MKIGIIAVNGRFPILSHFLQTRIFRLSGQRYVFDLVENTVNSDHTCFYTEKLHSLKNKYTC